MAEKKEPRGPGAPKSGFRLITEGGKEKFLPIPVPLANGDEQPASESPVPQPAPDPEAQEIKEAKIKRLEAEKNELLAALYWIDTQLDEAKGQTLNDES